MTTDPPDGVLVQLIYKYHFLFGRKSWRAHWRPGERIPFFLEPGDEAPLPDRTYLIVDEVSSTICGSMRDGYYRFRTDGTDPSGPAVLRLLPMARA